MAPVVRLRLDLAYDGTNFWGFAPQPGLRTVAGVLDQALEVVLGRAPVFVAAGRTDRGVHALGQVVHFDLDREVFDRFGSDIGLLLHRLRSYLRRDSDICLSRLVEVSADFNARFCATARTYRYQISDQRNRFDPSMRSGQYRLERLLNTAAMRQAAHSLVGLRDFGTFCKRRASSSTVRRLLELSVYRLPDGLIEVWSRSDAFCHHMVRSLVGALVEVGGSRLGLDQLKLLVDQAKRDSKIPLAPAAGLTLMKVEYPEPELWKEQAERTRSLRQKVSKDQ